MKKPKQKKLLDTCRYCDGLVWQYDKEGRPYCETHARWSHAEIERLPHPSDAHHERHVLSPRVDRAVKVIVTTIRRIGYAEAFWVAEHLAIENGVQWWDERVVIRLTDLQLVAFAAAMRAHREAMYPKSKSKEGAKKDAKKTKKPKKSRFAPLV